MPAAPDAPVRLNSTENSITVEWRTPSDSDLTVRGFELYMDDGLTTDLLPVYVGSSRPDVLRFVATELTTGLPYRFAVRAVSVNGNSEAS